MGKNVNSDAASDARVVGLPAHVALWDAIGDIIVACGGSPGSTSVGRQKAVARIEEALRALLRPAPAVSDAGVEAAIEEHRIAVMQRDRCEPGSERGERADARVERARDALRTLLRPAPAVSDAEHEAKVEAWASNWATCWNSVALRLPQDVLRQHEQLGRDAVALMRSRPAASDEGTK